MFMKCDLLKAYLDYRNRSLSRHCPQHLALVEVCAYTIQTPIVAFRGSTRSTDNLNSPHSVDLAIGIIVE
jgi:hypothetical protein